jgi:hypothetical protein
MKSESPTLVIQSFGREIEYKRAILTVLSFYAHCSLPVEQTRVLLFTDRPEYFSLYLAGLPVDFVLLTPQKIKDMRGKIDFLHRMKIAVIEEAFNKSDGNILYADSDSFFTANPLPLLQQLTPGKSFMHVLEYRFEDNRNFPLPAGKTFRAFLNLIETKSFYDANGQQISVNSEDLSWNAGVMMFHPSHVRFIPDVYVLTDQFYPETLNHASEQFAFSIILQRNTKIAACDDVVYHYWYRVKKQIVDLFLQKRMNEHWSGLSLKEKLSEVKQWTVKLPQLFTSHILTIRDNAIQAFNDNRRGEGYRHAIKAILKAPFDKTFLKDVLYHTKKGLIKRSDD